MLHFYPCLSMHNTDLVIENQCCNQGTIYRFMQAFNFLLSAIFFFHRVFYEAPCLLNSTVNLTRIQYVLVRYDNFVIGGISVILHCRTVAHFKFKITQSTGCPHFALWQVWVSCSLKYKKRIYHCFRQQFFFFRN